MHGFLVEFPRVELSMRVARRSDSLAALQAGKADFCMGVFPRLPQGIAAKVVARTTLSLVGRTEAEAEAEPVEGRRLIIAPRGTALRQVLRQSPHMEGRPNVLECPTCATALDLVRLGAGPAIVHTMCAPRTTDLYARDLGDRHGLMQVVVAYRRSTLRTRAAEAFYEHITG
jgi:DNA-binding transcriptional LysR family regulator